MNCNHSRTGERSKGVHLESYCLDCGAHIKFLRQPITRERVLAFIMPFGKHKGKTFPAMPRPYIEWLAENCTTSDSIRRMAASYLALGCE